MPDDGGPTRLVITTSGATLSVALLDGARVVAEAHHLVGRGHAEALMPAVAAVMHGQPAPGEILVDTGPGSFTGIRIGIAAARALGLAWGVPVHGITATALIAAGVPGATPLGVVIDAGRGRLYFQHIAADGADGDIANLAADEVAARMGHAGCLAGPGAASVLAHGAFSLLGEAPPRAADAAQLPGWRCRGEPLPRYIGGTMPMAAA